MDARILFPTLVTFFHDLFTAVWIGGLLVTVFSLMPAINKTLEPGPQKMKLMLAYQKAQGKWVHLCMVGLIVTGVLMSNRAMGPGQLFSFSNSYAAWLSLKHILVIVMVAIAVYRSITFSACNRKSNGPSPKQAKVSFLLIVVNALLGVVVLFISALIATLV